MRQRYVVATIAAPIVVLGSGAGLYGRNQLDARDAVIDVQQQQITRLSATLAFQDELSATRDDRDRLSPDLSKRTAERDSLVSQRDDLTNQLNAAQQELARTHASLDDIKGQLDQARQTGAAQQQRASSADARNNALTAVLKLDDQIHGEYANLFEQVRTMNQAIGRYDYFGAAAAYARAQTISDHLNQLFDQRKTALAAL